MAIIVINPNSNQAVTDAMARALKPLETEKGPTIECVTLAEGPFGIETQADAQSVVMPLRDQVMARENAQAFVIACYSDPGLETCRKATQKPVYGIQESGVFTALSHGGQFGVIALSDGSIERHHKYLENLGVMGRLAKERPANLSVAESAEGEKTFERLCEIGQELRDSDGAATIILGCAGMAKHRTALEEHLDIPIIDPVQAATSMAIGALLVRRAI